MWFYEACNFNILILFSSIPTFYNEKYFSYQTFSVWHLAEKASTREKKIDKSLSWTCQRFSQFLWWKQKEKLLIEIWKICVRMWKLSSSFSCWMPRRWKWIRRRKHFFLSDLRDGHWKCKRRGKFVRDESLDNFHRRYTDLQANAKKEESKEMPI